MALSKPIFLEFRSSTWFIVATVCIACFTDAFIYGVIIPVLPFSLRDIVGIPEQDIQFWNSMLLTSFGAAQFLFSPLLGHLADKSPSRRTPLLLGFIGTVAATGLLYLARSIWLLVLSRFLQGLAASVVYTLGFALLTDTVPEEELGHWMGFALSSLNVGIIIGPSIGGVLYDNFGYGSLFSAVFALVSLDIVLRLLMIEKKIARKLYGSVEGETERLLEADDLGCSTSYGSAQEDSKAATETSTPASEPMPPKRTQSSTSTSTPSSTPSTPPSTPIHPHPMTTLLTSPRILTDLYGAFISIFVLVSFDAAIPLFTASQFGWTSAKSGLIFLFISLPVLVGPLAGQLYDRYPYARVTASFFLLSAVFVSLLGVVTWEGFGVFTQQCVLCVLLTLYGFANSFGSLPLSADLSRAVSAIEAKTPGIFGTGGASAQVYALYTAASAAGVICGPAWTSFVMERGNWAVFVGSLGVLTSTIVVPVLLSRRVESKVEDGGGSV